LWLFSALVALLAVGALLVALRLRPHSYHGWLLDSPKPAADFTLTSGAGERVSLSDFRGKLVLLYFGYTYCPDVCPTSMAAIAEAMRQLGARAEDVAVLMVTVDPERDTPQRVGEYVAHFNPGFVGLSGTPEEIAAAATPLGIYYEKRDAGSSNYTVDHTATITVIDREGRVRLVFPFETTAEEIASDLAALLR
jgi:protein SCO1/2